MGQLEYYCSECNQKRVANGPCPKCGSLFVRIEKPEFKIVPDELMPQVKGYDGQYVLESTHPIDGKVFKFSINDAFKPSDYLLNKIKQGYKNPEPPPDKYALLRENYKNN